MTKDEVTGDAPRIVNRVHRTLPAIVHAPGTSDESPWWPSIRRRVMAGTSRFDLPTGLAIITWNSGSPNAIVSRRGHPLGTFERSLDHRGLPYTVLGRDRGSEWTNRMKLDLTLEFLAGTQAELILGADSSDVLLILPPAVIVARFNQQPAPVLFNAEKNPWPREAAPIFPFERMVAPRPFHYLNSGLWIGRRQALIEAFTEARRWADRLTAKPDSDQICWKYAYRELHPQVGIDARCAVFQCLNQVRTEIEVDGLRWPRLSWLTGRRPE